MKLIKCKKCGRPFYDNEAKCPYCGSETSLSAENYVTKSISDATSHKRMEDVLSGNYRPEPEIVAPVVEPVAEVVEPVAEPVATAVEETAAAVEETVETVPERAEAMAAIEAAQGNETVNNDVNEALEERQEVETSAPRKRHGWIWILIIVLLLAAAAAVYWKWDWVYPKVMSLFGK